VSVAGELTLWVGETVYVVSLGLTDDSETVQTYSALPLTDLRRVSEGLAAVVARLEREEEL
jgi:hypothetical protein